MLIPSSPSLSPSSQRVADTGGDEEVLTPSRKVKALLARFDESESDTGNEPPISAVQRDRSTQIYPTAKQHANSSEMSEQDSDDDDIIPILSRSRLAARLQGSSGGPTSTSHEKQDGDRRGKRTQKEDGAEHILLEEAGSQLSAVGEQQNGEAIEAPTRRLLKSKKSRKSLDEHISPTSVRSQSPLFFSSPRHAQSLRSQSPDAESSDSDELPDHALSPGNSKFLALVEKHRSIRLEKEAAEIAKRAAISKTREETFEEPRKQRGSSPADDTDENSDTSDHVAAKKLSSQARPTRKASKKALEEMNRETQRMTRNMQLAHQARTRKKVTKESLLQRFNFTTSANANMIVENSTKAASSSSVVGSDNDARNDHSTPPTSPLQEASPGKDKPVATSAIHASQMVPGTGVNHKVDAEISSHAYLPNFRSRDKGKGKARANSEEPITVLNASAVGNQKNVANRSYRPGSERPWLDLSKEKLSILNNQESDSDLDVITNKGDRKKYAAFERLPKRKARETRSHLMLRSLAHMTGHEDRMHSSMNAAELETILRKAARLQARQERQQKIEELKAKGVIVQTVEEREREQQEVEDLVEKARQEAAEIQKRERELAKRNGTFVKDNLDDDDDDESYEDDDDLRDDQDIEEMSSGSDDETSDKVSDVGDDPENDNHEENNLFDDEASQDGSDEESDQESEKESERTDLEYEIKFDPKTPGSRLGRPSRIISDDEDDVPTLRTLETPRQPTLTKTPQSVFRSARKDIPGLNITDDLPVGLTQAFAATMADSQSQYMPISQEQDSLAIMRDLPSPNISVAPKLQRLESLDVVSDSQPASQTQPLDVNLSFSQVEQLPQSPAHGLGISATQFTPSQMPFDPTQDGGYLLSPFRGNRFESATPRQAVPQSTVDTVIMAAGEQDSPTVHRKGKLRRGRIDPTNSDGELQEENQTAFEVMRLAAKTAKQSEFQKSNSRAREHIDEAAEESEDEYAGLGGVSDEEGNDMENEEDRNMIDEDTQVGVGDEAKLAGLYADRERQQDEMAVSKLLKDITTGALRRKRGLNDDLDLSDEEDAVARRREAKRREFAKMRRELLKDEAVGKIAEDKKKEAFLRSIEDREEADDDEEFDVSQSQNEDESQDLSKQPAANGQANQEGETAARENDNILQQVTSSKLNISTYSYRRGPSGSKKPTTLAEIRESVSFLIEEPESQAATIDLGLSDSEDEPEAYVNLDRHLQMAEADENADDEADDLGDFIVDDDGMAKDDSQEGSFKKPELPVRKERAPFYERRSKERTNVVNRLNLMRHASSSSSSSTSSSSTKMAFFTAKSGSEGSLTKVPSLLRRATTNSSLGSMTGRDESVSATGVVTNRTERGSAGQEKEFIRKGNGGRRNAVNYRPTLKEEKMSQRAGIAKKNDAALKKGRKAGGGGFLGSLFGGSSWA